VNPISIFEIFLVAITLHKNKQNIITVTCWNRHCAVCARV